MYPAKQYLVVYEDRGSVECTVMVTGVDPSVGLRALCIENPILCTEIEHEADDAGDGPDRGGVDSDIRGGG
jgi:hypothetical protein